MFCEASCSSTGGLIQSILTGFLSGGKRILAAGVVILTVALGVGTIARAETINFVNTPTNANFWDRAANWNPSQLPTTSDTALIADLASGTLLSSSIGFPSDNSTANVGTFLVTVPFTSANADRTYTRLIAGNPQTFDHYEATLNFATAGVITLHRTAIQGELNFFRFGPKELLTITNPGSITMNVAGLQVLEFESRIIGNGSLLLQQVSETSGVSTVRMVSGVNTFTGGITVSSGRLESQYDSDPINGGAFGKGTLRLNAGTLGNVLATSYAVANPIIVDANSWIDSTSDGADSEISVTGTITVNARRLTTGGNSFVAFKNAIFSGSDSGTISVASGTTVFDYSTNGSWGGGSTTIIGAVGEGLGTSALTGSVLKTGTAQFAASHFRVGSLSVQSGVLKVHDNGDNSGTATSHVNTLSISSGAKFDLSDNDLVINYSGTSPIGTPSFGADTIARYVRDGFNGGSTGLVSSVAATPTSALGFAEAADVGASSWQGISVDNTTVLVRYTFQGDSNVDGTVNISDFSLLASNFNTAQLWYKGDYNYSGMTDINDFALQAANFNVTGRRGGSGLSSIAELYIEMTGYPQLFHEARARPDIWWRFEEFERMNLAPMPAVPAGMRSVPEPAIGLIGLALVTAMRRRGVR